MYRLNVLFVLFFCPVILFTQTAEAQRRRNNRVAVRVGVRPGHRVVVRRAHVHYAHLPRWGSVVTVRPAGAIVIRSRRNNYYYHQGIYYRPNGSNFVVVRPARGLRVTVLPTGYRTVLVGPRTYYYYYGTYYSQISTNNEYETVDSPTGAVVDSLPDGYEVKSKSGNEYYVLDGVYYSEVDAPEFEDGVGYEVVEV